MVLAFTLVFGHTFLRRFLFLLVIYCPIKPRFIIVELLSAAGVSDLLFCVSFLNSYNGVASCGHWLEHYNEDSLVSKCRGHYPYPCHNDMHTGNEHQRLPLNGRKSLSSVLVMPVEKSQYAKVKTKFNSVNNPQIHQLLRVSRKYVCTVPT